MSGKKVNDDFSQDWPIIVIELNINPTGNTLPTYKDKALFICSFVEKKMFSL